jgi:hypothetical protein
LFNRETSAARRFFADEAISFYGHLNALATAAVRMDGCASTGVVPTLTCYPSSLKTGKSLSTRSTLAGMRLVVFSSGLLQGSTRLVVNVARVGLAVANACFVQIASTRSVPSSFSANPNVKFISRIVPQVLPSTVIFRQYTSYGSTAGSYRQSSVNCVFTSLFVGR